MCGWEVEGRGGEGREEYGREREWAGGGESDLKGGEVLGMMRGGDGEGWRKVEWRDGRERRG